MEPYPHPRLSSYKRGMKKFVFAAMILSCRPAMAALHEIRRRTPLDFYGIDFDLTKDGRVLFFEANAAMNLMLTDSPGRERVRGAMREAVRRLFESRAGLRA